MPDEELINEFTDRELEAMSIFLAVKAEKTALTLNEFIQTSLLNGVTRDQLKQTLVDDLVQGGRIFGEFRNSVRATSSGNLIRLRNSSSTAEIGIDVKYKWVAILVNTCKDCLARHGEIETWDGWEARGLPATGQTICKEHCHCVLLPADRVNIEPIQRRKR